MSAGDVLKLDWQGGNVALSIGIAFVGSYATVTLYEQYRLCSRENQPKLLSPASIVVLMAFSLGGIAIWTMHFVAMSSMKLINPLDPASTLDIYFRVDYTLISLIAVIALSYAGLRIGASDNLFKKDKVDAVNKFMKDARKLTIKEIRQIRNVRVFLLSTLMKGLHILVLGGTITGAGVCVMHYLGMRAMVFDGEIEWDAGIVAASVLIAVFASSAAFWILYRLLSFFPRLELLRIACSVVAALAVNGMHYCGQAAATFKYKPGLMNSLNLPASNLVRQSEATGAALVIALIFCFIVFILAISDLRVWYYNVAKILRELDIRATLASDNQATAHESFLLMYQELRSENSSLINKQILDINFKFQRGADDGSSPHSSSEFGASSNAYNVSHKPSSDQNGVQSPGIGGTKVLSDYSYVPTSTAENNSTLESGVAVDPL